MTSNSAEQSAADRETMNTGPQRMSKRSRRLAVVVTIVLIAGVVVGWRAWVVYTDIVTRPELHTAYTAAPASGGRDITGRTQPSTVLLGCRELGAVIGGAFWPTGALDGQSGGADGGQGPAGLMSFRYPDRVAATRSFERFASSVASCPTLRSAADPSLDMKVRTQPGIATSDTSLDLVLTGGSGAPSSLELSASRYKNVVTWAIALPAGGDAARGRAPAAIRSFDTGLAAADHIGG